MVMAMGVSAVGDAAHVFIGILFGHSVGDFLLQPQSMALTKGRPGRRGAAVCALHSLIYTLSICLFTWTLSPAFAATIFVTHAVIDRYSLGQKWLDFIGGRSFLRANDAADDGYKSIHVSFACIVYTVVDNSMHLMAAWYAAVLIGIVR